MAAPLIEIVYQLTEEDLLQQVRVKLKSRFRDPLIRTRIGFLGCYALAVVGLAGLIWLLVTGQTAPNTLSAVLFLIVAGVSAGYRGQKAYRKFYDKIKITAHKTDWLVFRAYRTEFSVTRPGIAESRINWTAIKGAKLTPHNMYIETMEDTVYRIPSRFVNPDQWDMLRGLLEEIWDVPKPEESGCPTIEDK